MTSTNSSSFGDLRIQSLLEISKCFLAEVPDSEKMRKSMQLLCESIEGLGVALYRRYYTGDESYYLIHTGSVCGKKNQAPCFPKAFRPEEMDDQAWKKLNTNVVDCSNEDRFDSLLTGKRIYIVPLVIKNLPYGLLIVSGPEPPDKKEVIQFLSAGANLFNLWLNTIDATKRLEDVFDSIPNPSFIMTTDNKIVYWNKANELMTGWGADQIIGKGNYESSLPYYGIRRPMVANLIMNMDHEWLSTYSEFEQDGDHVSALAFCPELPVGGAYLRTDTNRLYDVNNRLWGAIHIVRDVTMERQMRENLHRSESMYRSIADFAGVGILLVSNGEIIYANEQVEDFLGKSSNNINLSGLQQWISMEGDETIQTLMKKLLKGEEKLIRFEFQAPKNEKSAYFSALAQLVAHDNQQVIHFVIDDITEQKELDRRARMNVLKIIHEERLTSLGIMAAGIAHELNQPLNTIRVTTDGFLYCNEKGLKVDSDEIVNNIEMISRQVSRMSTVIRNIRNFSREDQLEELINVSINKAVETVFSMIGRQLEAHNITVHKKLEHNLPTIIAPVNQLEQVVTNLLINAKQAFDGCSHGHWQIWVETGVKNETVFLKIVDNATGIPKESLEKIFYPFFTTKQVGKGTGLGLSICQTILTSIKGELMAFNNENGGATFIVQIPLQEISNEYSGD